MADDELSEIERDFSTSWDYMEQFYAIKIAEVGSYAYQAEWLKPMFGLIAKLRERGYDHQFRAGQQLLALMLSRSRQHGLRQDQPSFSIEPNPNGGATVWYHEPPDVWIQFQIEHIEITPELDALLKRLLAHPID
ncbi:MAG: hypothetical protein ABI700_29370 [Chloroflexota bacterium]